MLLQDKSVIVTGASRGIGRATALACAREGADVLINYRAPADASAQHAQAADDVVQAVRALGRRAIAVEGDGFMAERLGDEIRDDATVAQPHARAVGIEDADDAGVYPMGSVVGHGHGFGKAFGFVVAAAGADGIDIAPIVFALRVDQGIAVAFAGAGEEEPSFFFPG